MSRIAALQAGSTDADTAADKLQDEMSRIMQKQKVKQLQMTLS